MLKMLHGPAFQNKNPEILERDAMRYLGDIDSLSPFESCLEYNSPAHGTWNIVHMGMLIPGSHQIYVCADNCNRGVILTAAEMNAVDRFSTIALKEEDLYNGEMEQLIIDGVSDILHRLPRKPSVILLFTVCVHHFMGCDIPYIYQVLRQQHPDMFFVECYMDPIMQKGGLTPDQKLRKAMYDCLQEQDKKEKQINIYGSNLPLYDSSEQKELLRNAGYTLKDLTECNTYDEFLSMGASQANVVNCPLAVYGARVQSKRLKMDYLYLPLTFSMEKIKSQMDQLADYLHVEGICHEERMQKAEEKLQLARDIIGDAPIGIDANATPACLSLARLLLEHGFHVTHLFADTLSGEEAEELDWIKKYAPKLRLYATIHPNMRCMPRPVAPFVENPVPRLAIGQKAAYFMDTTHFVNMAESGGLQGYDGICRMADWMIEAWSEEKNPKDYISRKGWGCECCL